jgi:hypothetical protein
VKQRHARLDVGSVPGKRAKRRGPLTQAEKNVVAMALMESPHAPGPPEINALAKGLRRKPDEIRSMMEEAREQFAVNAKSYVKKHLEVVTKAAECDDPKGWDVAQKGAAWAIEHMSAEGVRITEKEKAPEPKGATLMIGFNIGGIRKPVPVIEAVAEKVQG